MGICLFPFNIPINNPDIPEFNDSNWVVLVELCDHLDWAEEEIGQFQQGKRCCVIYKYFYEKHFQRPNLIRRKYSNRCPSLPASFYSGVQHDTLTEMLFSLQMDAECHSTICDANAKPDSIAIFLYFHHTRMHYKFCSDLQCASSLLFQVLLKEMNRRRCFRGHQDRAEIGVSFQFNAFPIYFQQRLSESIFEFLSRRLSISKIQFPNKTFFS